MIDLRGSTATLTVTATDSGDPPKKSTVPITVHFPGSNEDSAGVVASRGSTSGPILLAGLGTVLLLLSFVVALLVAYICKVYVYIF